LRQKAVNVHFPLVGQTAEFMPISSQKCSQ